ncbi:MAG: ABC transporter ATP-binding protein [Chloroflexota bacterium]
MLRVEKVSAHYGHAAALRGVSLSVNTNEVVTVIGSNGSGKTTLLNAISGVLPVSDGAVWLGDIKLTGLPAHMSVRLGLGYVPEGRALFGPMSVLDNLVLGAYSDPHLRGWRSLGDVKWCLRHDSVNRNLEYVFSLFPILKERQRQQANNLSGGEQQMLAIGRALMSSPRVLVLDEPSLGLAPTVVKEMLQLLVKLKGDGLAILLVEQDAMASLRISDRGYVMNRGRITIEGSAKALLCDDRVRQAYLGKAVT